MAFFSWQRITNFISGESMSSFVNADAGNQKKKYNHFAFINAKL
tara:strand:+ start:3119 stop:3250 length:132 start_codon:yes stop_codon:yes gene_type:complete